MQNENANINNVEESYQAKMNELKQKLEEINRLQSLANMLQRNIDSIPGTFTLIRSNLDTIANTLTKDEAVEVAQKIQLLSEQYKQLGIIICKKYNVVVSTIYANVKFEKQVIEDSMRRLNDFLYRQEAMKSVQRKIIDRL